MNSSAAQASLEWDQEEFVRDDTTQPAVRLGMESVRSVGEDLATRIANGRPYESVQDLVRRTQASRTQLEALATAGALSELPPRPGARPAFERRQALWAAGAVAQAGAGRLPGIVTGEEAPLLPELTVAEEVEADLWATGITVGTSAMELVRPQLDALGVIPATALAGAETDGKVLVAGVVTHRQRPDSAGGTVFLNLEDDTGMVNVICSPGAWQRFRSAARRSPALLVRGRLERTEGAVSVVAEKISPLELVVTGPPSRDFR